MKRDNKLDFIKGIACILMIFAHGAGYGKTLDNRFSLIFFRIGLYAPVLFLASTGVSLIYQLRKRQPLKIISVYLMLFLVSFANIGLRYIHYFSFDDWNLYAGIAISAILSLCIIQRINLLTVLIPVILFFILKLTNLGISFIYGGIFSVIPWISFTFLGIYLYRNKNSAIKLMVISFIFLLILLKNANFEYQDPYNSLIFITSGFLLYTFSLLIAPVLLKIKYLASVLIYLGKNSLLFYVIHRMLVIYLPFKIFAPVLWLGLLIISTVIMFILRTINRRILGSYPKNYLFWVFILIVIFIPYLIPQGIQFQRIIMFAVLITHALNYHYIADLGLF